MNAKKADLQAISRLEPMEESGLYKLSSVPKPHSDFETYAVWLSDALGLCRLVAIGKTVETSVYGSELKQHFESIEEALKERYGNNKKHDFLRSGSIWDDPEDWTMALLRKERYLTAYWDEEEKSSLPPGIHSIMLDALALSTNKGYLRLIYESPRLAACEEERKKKKASVFE